MPTMPRLSPNAARILRWLAFLPTVIVVASADLLAAQRIFNWFGDQWLTSPVLALGAGVAVYVGSGVAPSRRRWPIFLAAGLLLVFFVFVFLSFSWSSSESRVLSSFGVGGIALGTLFAWLRIREEPVQAVRTGRSLRYKGTAPFQHSVVDRKTFFGRDLEVRSLLSLVLAERLVVLFGKSGVGKSSLINAGLAGPLLDRGCFPITVRLVDRARGPLGGLLDGVRAAAHAANVEIVGGDESDLWKFFNTVEFWSRNDNLLRPVLIVDQFEELFTLHAPAPRHEFVAQLAEVVRGRAATRRPLAPAGTSSLNAGPTTLKIVLSLREDYLADLEDLARDIPGILQRRFRIGALTVANARDAIVKPAALLDAAFDTPAFAYRNDALDRILGFLASRRHGDEIVKDDAVEPVQLQLACQYVEELVRTRLVAKDGTRVEVSEVDLGGESQLRRVLEDFYDRTLAAIGSPWERRRVRRLCERRLISGAGRRLPEAEEDIEKSGVSKDTLQQLVDTRLLRPEPRLGGVFYELSHDTLIEPILRSRQKRIARTRRIAVGTTALLVAYLAPWWVLTGRQTRHRQQALDLVATGLPNRNDPGQLLALPNDRLRAIKDQFEDAAGTREGFGAMMFVAEEVALRYPELKDDVKALRNKITQEFDAQHGLTRPDAAEGNPLALISAGSFQMGEGSDQHPVTLSAFRMQEHEVTNHEYRRFDPSHDRGALDNLPVVRVSWYEAMAYAAWLGGSLPTEAQWEFAARGKEGRTYPWGDESPTCDRANFGDCGVALRPVKVDRERGKTPEGMYDLAGNVWEWCRDWTGDYPRGAQKDPVGPATGSNRVLRGGSFPDGPGNLRGALRVGRNPGNRLDNRGFRVVWPAAGGPE